MALPARLPGGLRHRLDCISAGSLVALDDPGDPAQRIMNLGLVLSF